MVFNTTKFEVLKHGKNEELKDNYSYFTPEYEDIIKRKDILRDLGVMANDKANFEEHINKVCTSVTKKVGWILQTFSTSSTSFMKLLWKQLVQGHIVNCGSPFSMFISRR